jgi:hypothetical protein
VPWTSGAEIENAIRPPSLGDAVANSDSRIVTLVPTETATMPQIPIEKAANSDLYGAVGSRYSRCRRAEREEPGVACQPIRPPSCPAPEEFDLSTANRRAGQSRASRSARQAAWDAELRGHARENLLASHPGNQSKSAPVAAEGVDAGEAVDPKWATNHGHAADAARYGALSRPSPSEEPPPPLQDERAEALRQTYVRERELSEEMEFEQYEDSLYGG